MNHVRSIFSHQHGTTYSLYFFILPVRVLAVTYDISLSNLNIGVCKLEYFVFYATRTTSTWLIVSTCIDRYLHSSSYESIRRLSSMKTARIAIGVISIIVPIFYIHILGFYEIANVSNQYGVIAPQCNGRKGIYRTFFGFLHMTVYSLCPSFLMLLFGLLTLNNIRQRRRIIRRNNENRVIRRTDIQLLRMLTIQVIVIILSTLPFSIYQLYISFTGHFVKSTLQTAQDNLASRITGLMTYFTHSSSFYLYTLTGTIFRKEVFKLLRRCCHPTMNRVNFIDTEIH